MQKGLIVFIEGFDYTGKTSLIEKIKEGFGDDDKVCYLKFPSNRKIIFRHYANELDEAMSFYHDQMNVLTKTIEDKSPNLIICDRGPISNYAYQWSKMNDGLEYFKYYERMFLRMKELGYIILHYVIEESADVLLRRFRTSKKNEDKIDKLNDSSFLNEFENFKKASKLFHEVDESNPNLGKSVYFSNDLVRAISLMPKK